MAEINIGKSPPNSAILPFYATGAIAFFLLCILLFFSAESLTTHYFNPHLLTIVHLAALGWGTMIIYGAAHQLLPVICERDLYSARLAEYSWVTLSLGTALLAYSFWNFHLGWPMITGGSLIVLSAIFYSINVYFTSRICTRYNLQKLFLLSSASWLLFTTLVGLLLAINLVYPYFSKNHLEILKLHAHAGLAGWFLQLIAGVSSKLVPMFLLGKSSKDNLLKYAFIFQNAALILFLADGYFFEITGRILIYATIMLVGIICWLMYLYDTYKNRVRKKVELLMKHAFISFICLLIAVVLIPIIYYFNDHRWSMIYGTLLFFGWITSIILGKTFKTLPFIVWNGHYKHLSGKVKVPLPKHLYSEKLISYQFSLFLAALLSLVAGILINHLLVIKFALGLWVIVSLIYLYNVVKVLRHKTTTLQ